MWTANCYDTMEDYIEDAKKYPGDIPKMLQYATTKQGIGYEIFVPRMIKEKLIDVNELAWWNGEYEVNTTLLLEAVVQAAAPPWLQRRI